MRNDLECGNMSPVSLHITHIYSILIGLLMLFACACQAIPNQVPVPESAPRLLLTPADIPLLRERAKTLPGKLIVRRMRQALQEEEGPFGMSSKAVGYATLYMLTSNTQFLDSAVLCALGTVRDSLPFVSANPTMSPIPLWQSNYKAIYRSELLMDIAITNDICRAAWPEAVSEEVSRELWDKAQLLAPGPSEKEFDSLLQKPVFRQGMGYNSTPWSNWQGIVNGGVGVALLALADHPQYGQVATALLDTVRQACMEHFEYFGDYMWTAEGFNYLRYELCAGTAPFVLAYRNVMDSTFLQNGPLQQALPFFVSQSVVVGDSIYTPIYGQLQTTMQMSRWRSGIWLLLMGLSDAQNRAVCKWLFDQVYGIEGTQDFNIFQAKDALYALLYYPFGVEGLDPNEVYPLTLRDSIQGYYLFRNQWGKDEIVATILDNHQARRASHSHQDAGSIRLIGLGEDWIYKANKALRSSPAARRHSAAFESVVQVAGANNWSGGSLLYYESDSMGSGRVKIDMTDVYRSSRGFREFESVGVTRAIRDFELAFEGSEKVILNLRDTIIGGGEKTWQIATPQREIEIGPSGFVVYNADRSKCLSVVFEGSQKPVYIRKEMDLIQAGFGAGDLYAQVRIVLTHSAIGID